MTEERSTMPCEHHRAWCTHPDHKTSQVSEGKEHRYSVAPGLWSRWHPATDICEMPDAPGATIKHEWRSPEDSSAR